LKKNDEILYTHESLECWVEDFKEWLTNKKKLRYPASVIYDYKYFRQNYTQREYINELISEFVETTDVGA